MPSHFRLWRVKLKSIVITYNVLGDYEAVMEIILKGCESEPQKRPTVIMIAYIQSDEL